MSVQKFSILLVEDEENLHEALKLNLELEGYEITSAFDGTEAIKKIENRSHKKNRRGILRPDHIGRDVTRAGRHQRDREHQDTK